MTAPTCPKCGAALPRDGVCPACLVRSAAINEGSTRTDAGSILHRPASIGPYKVLDTLGEGGMGIVYLVDQEHPLRRRVALKVIKIGMDTRDVVARFESEGQALALMDHPHIAQVYDAGVIHRDLKPQNIMVTKSRHVRLLDFGIAKVGDDSVSAPDSTRSMETAVLALLGTPAYMAPEQIQQHHVDERCDFVALVAVLYECLTGRRAFSGSSVVEVLGQVLHVDPPPASQLRANLIEAHHSLPAAARKDPRDRFQSSAVSCDR
jgi:serine/threonine protein kinase